MSERFEDEANDIVEGWMVQEKTGALSWQAVLKQTEELIREAERRGMMKAVEMVKTHWNDSSTMTNQKDQAWRSANAIKREADKL